MDRAERVLMYPEPLESTAQFLWDTTFVSGGVGLGQAGASATVNRRVALAVRPSLLFVPMVGTCQKVVCLDDRFPLGIQKFYTALPKKDVVYVVRGTTVGIGLDGTEREICVYLVGLGCSKPTACCWPKAVNWCEVTVTYQEGKMTYRNGFITDFKIIDGYRLRATAEPGSLTLSIQRVSVSDLLPAA